MSNFKIFVMVCCSHFAFAETLVILNSDKASKASYVSQELNETLPFFISNGDLLDLAQTQEAVFHQGKTACTIWLMDFSEIAVNTKSDLQFKLLINAQQWPLWKNISGKAIFIDEVTDFAISYNCIKLGITGTPIEVDFLQNDQFNTMFKGILAIH